MSKPAKRRKTVKRILAVDPFSRGVGFAVLEGPYELIDWGLKTTTKADNVQISCAIEALIERFHPDVLVLEDWNAKGSRRCDRVQTLLDQIASVDPKRVRVCLISLRRLKGIGPLPLTGTKSGRGRYIADRFPELELFLPPRRKPWMPEDDRWAIFDAVGFALACLPVGVKKPGKSGADKNNVSASESTE